MASLFILICLLLPPGQHGSPQQPRRDADEYIKILESEKRIEGLQVEKVVAALQVKPGDKVADIGSGAGLFTRPLARSIAPSGMLYAIDVDPKLLAYVEKSAKNSGISNVKTVLATDDDPKLPEAVDLIVIIDTLHHIGNQATYLKGLKQYLRPGGRIAVIDFSKIWPAGHESMIYHLSDLERWMHGAGLKRVVEYSFLENDFFVVYR